jgi:hypothetical protein
MLLLLTIIIIIEFTHVADEYHVYLLAGDYIIIGFFVIDLLFKYNHSKDMYSFVRVYWIDLIAVFPFYAVTRLFSVAAEFAAASEGTQKLLHESALLREARFLRELEVAKFAKEGRLLRVIPRSLRLLRARWYFAHGHFMGVSEGHRKHHMQERLRH